MQWSKRSERHRAHIYCSPWYWCLMASLPGSLVAPSLLQPLPQPKPYRLAAIQVEKLATKKETCCQTVRLTSPLLSPPSFPVLLTSSHFVFIVTMLLRSERHTIVRTTTSEGTVLDRLPISQHPRKKTGILTHPTSLCPPLSY